MRKLTLGLLLATAVAMTGCAKNPVARWDQVHVTYNAVADAALTHAEKPFVSDTTKKLIADIVVRTSDVVEEASKVADLPQDDATQRYLQWANVVVLEAIEQLNAYLTERALEEQAGFSPGLMGDSSTALAMATGAGGF